MGVETPLTAALGMPVGFTLSRQQEIRGSN